MNAWGWSRGRTQGIWRYGPVWMRPFLAAVPWITVGFCFLLLFLLGGTFTVAKGVLFDLPDSAALAEGEATRMVALVLPQPHETLVFFDDARYRLGDVDSMRRLAEHFQERSAKLDRKTLLVLADRRVAGGELMKLASIARLNGISRILFAERHDVTEDDR